jgi:hypothetical protein
VRWNEIRWDQSLGGGGRLDALGVGPGCAAGLVRGRRHDGGGASDPGRDAGDAGDPFELHAEAEYGQPITGQVSRELIAWADENKMKRAMEILAKSSAREARMQAARPEPELPKAAAKPAPGEDL